MVFDSIHTENAKLKEGKKSPVSPTPKPQITPTTRISRAAVPIAERMQPPSSQPFSYPRPYPKDRPTWRSCES